MDNKELIDKINKASDFISKKARNGSGNFMIVNSKVADVIQDIQLESELREINNQRAEKLKDILNDESI